MSIDGRAGPDEVSVRTVAAEARRWRHDHDRAAGVAAETAQAMVDAVNSDVIEPQSPLARCALPGREVRFVGAPSVGMPVARTP
jgi:hypothetical protein